MLQVVIDTSIYRSDPKRNKAPFRALTRLLGSRKVQLHIPYYVKKEFITQQYSAVMDAVTAIKAQASALERKTGHAKLKQYIEKIRKNAEGVSKYAETWVDAEFNHWVKESRAVEHSVSPAHGKRVTDDYFSGAPPFRGTKNREDIPDSFIWQTILDLAAKYHPLHVVSGDGALYTSATQTKHLVAHKSLEEFIQSQECQQALKELADETVTANIERVTALLPRAAQRLLHVLETKIIDALVGETVVDRCIPDDNNEGMITSVGEPQDVIFDFGNVEYYGDGEFEISFETSVECTLNYAIFKADYYTMGDEQTENISIGERNEHYFDAEEDYTIEVKGKLSLALDTKTLDKDLADEDISDLIEDAQYKLEIAETGIAE